MEHLDDSSPSHALEPACRHSADAHGKREHQQQNYRAEHAAPVFGVARKHVLQPGEGRGSDQGTGERIDSAEQHDQQGVDGTGNGQCVRRDAAFGKRVQAAGQPREGAGHRERKPLRAPDIDANGWRPQ